MPSPAFVAYNRLDGIDAYAHPDAAGAVSMGLINDPRVKAVAAKGCKIHAYVGFMESPTSYGAAESDLMYEGRPSPAKYLWQPRRENYPGLVMTDVRKGSAWGLHAVEYVKGLRKRIPHVRGLFLDVWGDRLWSPVWSAMSALERAQWTEGMDYWLPIFRDAAGLPVICNGSQTGGNPNADGVAIENHPIAENANGTWTKYLAQPFAGDDHFVICRTLAEALAWSKVPGVRWVAHQPNGSYAAPGPVWGPFTDKPYPESGPIFTDPGEDPDPDPGPPPSTGGPTQAQYDAVIAERDAARAGRDTAIAARRVAEDTLARVRSGVAAETQRHGTAVAAALDGAV